MPRHSDPERPGAPAVRSPGVRAHAAAPSAAVLRLQRSAGNAAVARLLRRRTNTPKPAKDIAFKTTRLPGRVVDFETKKANLGDIEVHFTGRLAITGKATIDGEDVPAPAELRKAKHKTASEWMAGRVRALAKQALDASTPTGSDRRVELDVGGETVVLELAQGFAGLPPFAVSGRFAAAKKDMTFASVTIPKASLALDVTAWITPAAAKPGPAPAPAAGDKAIKRFAWGGEAARFEDTHKVGKREVPRTGAIVLWDSIRKLERELPDVVLRHKFLRLPEQRVAFLQEMRGWFGSDDKTIAHFKQLRKVNIRDSEGLILHDEAASRLEAVQAELGRDSMPSTTVGWPRSECTLGGKQIIGNLHNLGFAVDFNATETPNLAETRLRDFVAIVTGGVQMGGGRKRDAIEDFYTGYVGGPGGLDQAVGMARTEQRGVMADPDAASDLGKLLARIEAEAEEMSDRSEALRTSLDVKDKATGTTVEGAKQLAALKAKYVSSRAGTATWTDAERDALARVTRPWRDTIDADLAEHGKRLTDVGFSLSSLARGDALKAEEKSVRDAVTAAEKLRKRIKDEALGGSRAETEKRLAALRRLLGAPVTTDPKDLDDAKLLAELDKLVAAARARLERYGTVRWYQRVQDVRAALDDPRFVLGTSHERAVKDPALAQLVDLGFFTLKQHSRSGPGGRAQGGAFDVPFVKAMVKHGFNLGARWGAPTDSMHFELRWRPKL